MEDTVNNAVEGSLNVNAFVIPGLDELRHDPFDSSTCDLAGRLIEDVGEMVLRKHRMGWVRGVVVTEDNMLLVHTSLNDFVRSGIELILDLIDEWNDVRGEEREDEFIDLVLKRLYQIRQNRDLFDRFSDGLHYFGVKFDEGFYLCLDINDVAGPLFGLTGRDAGVLYLLSLSILLQLIRFTRLIFVAEDTVRDLAEEVLEDAAILLTVRCILKCTLKLLNLALRSLVIELTADGVQEVDTSERASDNRIDFAASTSKLHSSPTSNMREDIVFTHLDQSKLDVVGVCREVF